MPSFAALVLILPLLTIAVSAGPVAASPTPITTVAGTGAGAYTGNGGPATGAALNEPYDVVSDAQGNLYVADYLNCVVRKITPTGTISTVAGNGMCGNSGIGGPATAASISNPAGLAVDGNGNLYIADRNNCRVLVVPPNGTIGVKAGNGVCGYSGDGGPAVNASLTQVEGLAVDSAGDLFIADANNCVVREVNTVGDIYTVAGDGVCGFGGDGGPADSASLLGPEGVTFNAATETLYVADTGNCVVRAVHNGLISTVAGVPGQCGYGGDGGPATGAQLNEPFGLAIDSAGNLLVADTLNCAIRSISPAGTITTSAGTPGTCGFAGDNGPPTQAVMNEPFGVGVNAAGDIFVADTLNNRVREYGLAPPIPLVTSVSPASGGVSGGSQVTIRGLNLLGTTAVDFGGTPAAAINVVSDVEIVATVPAGPSGGGRVDVTVKTPAGTSPTGPYDGYLYVSAGPYHPLTPTRIADTRPGSGLANQGETLQAGGSVDVQVASAGGVPATGAVAVVVNLTVTDTTSTGYVTAYPTGVARPLASAVNFTAGLTVANLVEVALGENGRITVYNSAGSTNVIVDVEGWVGAGLPGSGLFEPLPPARIADTRPGSGEPDAGKTLGPRQAINVQVAGAGGVPASGVASVVLNVTATGTTSGSFLTVWPTGSNQPLASNLNWSATSTVPNRVIVQLGFGGMISIYNNAGNADVIVDVGGWFTNGSNSQATGRQFLPASPVRVEDTRSGSGEPGAGSALGPGGTLPVQVSGVDGVPASGVAAVVLNVTVTSTTSNGYLTAFPDGEARPVASDLNWTAGNTVANCVVVKLGTGGRVDLYNSSGSTDVIVDVVGWYF